MLASQKAAFFLAKLNKADLEVLRELLEAGKLRSVVDDVFPFEQVANALEQQGGASARHDRGHAARRLTVACADGHPSRGRCFACLPCRSPSSR